MPFTPQAIYEEQQTPEYRLMLRASTAVHGRVELVDRVRWIASTVIAACAIAGIFYPDLRVVVSTIGFVFGLASTLLWTRIRDNMTRDATIIQEQFDTGLFDLPWSRTSPAQHGLVYLNRWARRAPEPDEKPWYVDVRGIPSPVAEAICQRENVLWDSDLRKGWSTVCKAVFAILVIGLLITGLALQLSLWHFMSWIVFPTSSLFGTILAGFYQQASAIEDREKIRADIHRHLSSIDPLSEDKTIEAFRGELRSWQDDIYRSRLSNTRVPSWFFRLSRERDEKDHGEEAAAFRRRWSNKGVVRPGDAL